MRLKSYRASSIAEAMAQVRSELGPEALILSTRKVPQGVELTAALEQQEEPHLAEPAPSPATIDFSRHDLPGRVSAALSGQYCFDGVARALSTVLRFEALPTAASESAASRPLFLAGMPGAGKTLAVARLATRLVLSGIRPTVITADGRRAGAAEELAAFTRLLGVRLMVAGTPATLARALRAASDEGPPGPVLIDSSGINPFATMEVQAVADLVATAEAHPVLVMQAGLHPDDAAEQARAFSPIGARHLLPTRLDLTRRLGSILSACIAGDLALTEASSGPGAADPLVAVTPKFLASRLIGAEPTPAVAAPLRRPVFPTARAQAAQAWSLQAHG